MVCGGINTVSYTHLDVYKRQILRRGALALPMEQALIAGIIVVHGGWRIVLVRLVQRHKEHSDVFLWQPLHALTNGGRLHKVQRHQELVAGIGCLLYTSRCV